MMSLMGPGETALTVMSYSPSHGLGSGALRRAAMAAVELRKPA